MLTDDLFSVHLLLRVNMVIHYNEVDFTFGLPDYVRYMEDSLYRGLLYCSRFYSIHFTVTLDGTQNIVCYIDDFVK